MAAIAVRRSQGSRKILRKLVSTVNRGDLERFLAIFLTSGMSIYYDECFDEKSFSF